MWKVIEGWKVADRVQKGCGVLVGNMKRKREVYGASLSGTYGRVLWNLALGDPCSPGKALIRFAGGQAERQGSSLVKDENQGPGTNTELEQKVMTPFKRAQNCSCVNTTCSSGQNHSDVEQSKKIMTEPGSGPEVQEAEHST